MNGPVAAAPARWLAASVLLPLLFWWPWVLDDVRLDGGLFALMTLGAVSWAWLRAPKMTLPPGWGWLAGAMALATLGWLGTPWAQVVGGFADRAPWWSALALLAVVAHDPRATCAAERWLFWGAVACAWYALLQIVGFDPLGLKPSPESPPTAPLPGRAHATEFYLVVVVAGAAYIPWRKGRLWFLGLMPMAFLCGYYGLLAARLALPLGLALVWRRQRGLAWALAFLLLAQLGGECTRILTAPPYTVRDEGEAGLPPWASVHGRSLLYGAALRHSLDHPRGIGFGRFEADYPFWRPLEEQRLSAGNYQNVATRRPKTPHNELLLVILEWGWLGAALAGWGLWRLLRRPDRARWTDPALLTLGALALVRSPLSDNTLTLALAAWLLGRSRPSSPPPSSLPAPAPPHWLARPWLLLGVALLGAWPALSQVVGEIQVGRRVRVGLDQPADPALLTSAMAWRPWDSRAAGLLAVDRSHQVQPSPPEILAALYQALEHDPADLFSLMQLFKAQMESGLEAPALSLLARAEALAPEHPAVRANRTLYIRAKADVHRLRGIEAMRQNPGSARADMWLAQMLRALAEIRDGHVETARKALDAAAVYAAGNRGRIERIARHPDLNEGMVRDLVVALVAGGEALAGPPAPVRTQQTH